MAGAKKFATVVALAVLQAGHCVAASLKDDFTTNPTEFFNTNFNALVDIAVDPADTDTDTDTDTDADADAHEEFSLDTCAFNPEISDGWIERVSTIALYYSRNTDALNEAGYPKDVWEEKLNDVVVYQLDRISGMLSNDTSVPSAGRIGDAYLHELKLYNSVVEYANDHPSIKIYPSELKGEDSCGGDFIGNVKVDTQPKAVSFKILSEFSFKLCQSRGQNAYNTECADWREIEPDGEEVPAGMYRYWAIWPDGDSTCSLRDLTPAEGWPDPDVVPPMTITKSASSCPN
ncbi:hypothetical protein [Rhizobium leguminosarum]|uniref:hypothetical protein n=1 Tax=Rhizobium leguminosarum TaxID=384 RepID=UPI001C96518F|nr:hypothetical protein [Rhizobium leguminosarum]MBY5658298.1 hypothetical protein [Rhizobium leguminosarum]